MGTTAVELWNQGERRGRGTGEPERQQDQVDGGHRRGGATAGA
jgi:hypothetical protein